MEAFVGEVAVVSLRWRSSKRTAPPGTRCSNAPFRSSERAGTLVVADAKRGDIGSTMAAYAQSWLGAESALSSDAVTASPIWDSVRSTRRCRWRRSRAAGSSCWPGRPIPRAGDLQAAQTAGGASVAQSVVDAAVRHNERATRSGGSAVGAMCGHGPDSSNFSGPDSAPGLGAQGATPGDLADIFPDLENCCCRTVLVAFSVPDRR